MKTTRNPAEPPANHMANYDVIVVGGGHAGCEAAAASARLGARTALLTHNPQTIGEMSCNPAIGGLGKGHLVREIDAFDGLMGRVADQAGIQFRLLNRSKGPAVQGPRAQADRKLYRQAMQAAISATKNLTVVEGGVEDLVLHDGRVSGVITSDGRTVTCGSVVLTTGTFLNGLIHRGDVRIPAGRAGEAPALKLSERLYGLGLKMGRLKTGTPARLDGRSIDWSGLEMQPGDDNPVPFSFLTKAITTRQISCGITQTSAATHDWIQYCLAWQRAVSIIKGFVYMLFVYVCMYLYVCVCACKCKKRNEFLCFFSHSLFFLYMFATRQQ